MTEQTRNLQFDLYRIASAVNNLQFWLIYKNNIDNEYIQYDLNKLIETLKELKLDDYKVDVSVTSVDHEI
jgi:hypothetical protein